MQGHLVSRIAAQIFVLRKQRNWTQEQLAAKAGVAQERVSKIESADFTSLTLASLNKFAEAFDVSLRVSFEPFSQGILDVANFRPQNLAVPAREADLAIFCGQDCRIGNDGNWRVSALSAVRTQERPQSEISVHPTGSWQFGVSGGVRFVTTTSTPDVLGEFPQMTRAMQS